jgi:GNAT superfamily N-acetyltransferase
MRLAAFFVAVAAVIFLGHVLFMAVQFGQFAMLSLLIGLLATVAAAVMHRRAGAKAPDQRRPSTDRLVVRPVAPAAVRPMRSSVLRPGQPPRDLIYDGDDDPLALHVAAYEGAIIRGIATVYPETPPPELLEDIPKEAFASGASFRLRGMATDPEHHGRGIGRKTLQACFEHIRQQGASYIWCNARLAALPFYERLGFIAVGEVFEIEGIGPHYVMWRSVDADGQH